MAFPFTRVIAASSQRGAKPAFESRENALGLPAVSVLAAVEPTHHLSSVKLLGPFPRAASIQSDHGRADAQPLAGHLMIGLGVIPAVSQHPVDIQVPTGLKHRRPEQGRVVRRPDSRDGGGNQMSGGMTDDRELGMLAVSIASVSVTEPSGVVCRTDRGREAGGIDRRFGLLLDQARFVSILEDRSEQEFKTPFFASLRRAWKRVVWCGSFFSSKVWHRLGQSQRYATRPRSSVLRNCSNARRATNWCWVKSFLENLDAYAGTAWLAT